jgi:hypothetical protein
MKGGASRDTLWREFFPEAIGTCFPQQHADRHRVRWNAAHPSLQRRFLEAGRVPAALWKTFMKKQPNPHARRDAAQKQLNRVQKRHQTSHVEEEEEDLAEEEEE